MGGGGRVHNLTDPSEPLPRSFLFVFSFQKYGAASDILRNSSMSFDDLKKAKLRDITDPAVSRTVS